MVIMIFAAFLIFPQLLAGCSPAVSAGTGLFVSNLSDSALQDGSQCHPFQSLAVALSTVQTMGDHVVLWLETDVLSNETLEPLVKQVVLGGRGNHLTLGEAVCIEKSAGLIVVDAKVLYKKGVEVKGLLRISRSEVRVEAKGIEIYGGVVQIEDSEVYACRETFMQIEESGSQLAVRNVTFEGNQKALVSLGSSVLGLISMEIADSSFADNSAPALLDLSAPSSNCSVQVRITRCDFLRNAGAVLYALLAFVAVDMSSCDFQEGNSGLSLYGTAANATFANITWTGNSGLFLDFALQQSVISVSSLSIQYQHSAGVVAATGLSEASNCLLLLDNVDYRDTHYFYGGRSAGLLRLQACSCFLTHTYIANVSIGGYFGLYNAFIDAQQSYLQLNSLQMANSTSNQAFFYLVLSSVLASNLTLQHLNTGLNTLIIGSLSPGLTFTNVQVSHATAISTSDSVAVSTPELMCFTLQLANITVVDLEFSFGLCKCLICAFFGTSSFSNLQIRSMGVSSGVVSVVRGENVSNNFTIVDSTLRKVWDCGIQGLIQAKGIVLRSVSLHIALACGIHSICSATDVSLWNVTGEMLLLGGHTSTVSFQTLSVTGSTFKYAFKSAAQAVTSVRNATFEDCQMGLISLYRCHFLLSASHFSNIHSVETFLVSIQSTIELYQVKVTNVTVTAGQLGRLAENSHLSMVDFQASSIVCTTGIKLMESHIEVRGARIAQFAFTLLEAKNGNVTLHKSTFSYGGSTDRRISQRGALLSCSNCPSIHIDSVKAFHLVSPEGGAVSAINSLISINSSWFEHCGARKGGAVQLTQTAYTIRSSNFTNCWAETTGGALDIANSDPNSAIWHSDFIRNSAQQGGGVKFHQKVGVFVRTFFEQNSANYGPDLASYGIKARISPKFPASDLLLSGNSLPSPLDIEILDHYGQVVLVDSDSELLFLKTNTTSNARSSSKISENGVFHLHTSPFYAPPNTSQSFPFTVSFSKAGTAAFELKLSFRPCQRGEIHRLDRCLVCAPGTFSFFTNDTDCALCPNHVFCAGKDSFRVTSGYWRSSLSSDFVHTCPYATTCSGGENSSCSAGYEGKLCTECQADYYRVGTLYCEKCSMPAAVFQVCLFVGQCLVVFYLAGRYAGGEDKAAMKFAKLWLWVEHTQYLMVLLRLKTQLPFLYYYSLRPFHFLGSLSVSSIPLSCLFPIDSAVYEQTYISFAVPLVALLPSLVTFLTRLKVSAWKALLNRWLLISCLCGPALLESFSNLIISFLYEDRKRWLFSDASIEAWSSDHSYRLKYTLVPVFVLYLLLPIPALLIATRKESALAPFLKYGLKPNWAFIGICVHIWKLLFVFAIISVFSLSRLFQVTLALTLLIPLLVLLVAFEPYESRYQLFLAVTSKMIVYSGFSAAGYYTEQSPTELGSGYFFGSAFLLVNCAFSLLCIRSFRADVVYNDAALSPLTNLEMRRIDPPDLLAPPNSYIDCSPPPIASKEEVTFAAKFPNPYTV